MKEVSAETAIRAETDEQRKRFTPTDLPAVAERLRRAYPALTERAGVGSIPANPDARNVPSFRRWRFEMKLSPFYAEQMKTSVWQTL
jgi:hypothetical protein